MPPGSPDASTTTCTQHCFMPPPSRPCRVCGQRHVFHGILRLEKQGLREGQKQATLGPCQSLVASLKTFLAKSEHLRCHKVSSCPWHEWLGKTLTSLLTWWRPTPQQLTSYWKWLPSKSEAPAEWKEKVPHLWAKIKDSFGVADCSEAPAEVEISSIDTRVVTNHLCPHLCTLKALQCIAEAKNNGWVHKGSWVCMVLHRRVFSG